MHYTENTKLSDILADHPWLAEELPKQDPVFAKLNTPAARLLIRHLTVKDAGRMGGLPAQTLLEELEKLIARHG